MIAKELERFDHPSINKDSTNVKLSRNKENPDKCELEVRLYDKEGAYVLEDHGMEPYYVVPGLLFSVSEKGSKVCIERVYVKPEYRGNDLGTEVVRCFELAATLARARVICLDADLETKAGDYWKTKHGFAYREDTNPNYMEKDLILN